GKIVSIHAPARGATYEGVLYYNFSDEFQSTRPRGARHKFLIADKLEEEVSIHAPARGATLFPSFYYPYQ
ncbi:MAG: hypothetical protein ONA69_08765, partial [candidate division KSB1 bacterium]|nr:hypothetical protein [candidate division KSB1 bacterium]